MKAKPTRVYDEPPDVDILQCHALTTTFPVFLSSVCTESEAIPAPESEVWALRETIFREIGGTRQVYVDEQLFRLRKGPSDHMATVDRLVPRIRDSELFICILAASRAGCPINVGAARSAVTFFEMELFQAALSIGSKPVYVFMRDAFRPSEGMQGILRLIENVFPAHCVSPPMSDGRIKDEVRRLVDRANRRSRLVFPFTGLLPSPGIVLVRTLDAIRAPKCPYSQLRLLNGIHIPGGPRPEGHAVDALVAQTRTERNAEKRLSRLWLALRELMQRPFDGESDPTVLRQWEVVLGAWAKAGAWYGLHGHTPLGTLAALNTASEVKRRIQDTGIRPESAETARQGGALASAKYSIGRRLRGGQRDRLLREALGHLDEYYVNSGSDMTGVLLIRGSILLCLHERTEAIEAFKKALALREGNPTTSAHEIGQAMSELGFGYLRTFHLRRGLSCCEESIRLLRTTENLGFLARGLRKLHLAYCMNGMFLKAHATYQEWKQLVKDNGLYDQSP